MDKEKITNMFDGYEKLMKHVTPPPSESENDMFKLDTEKDMQKYVDIIAQKVLEKISTSKLEEQSKEPEQQSKEPEQQSKEPEQQSKEPEQ